MVALPQSLAAKEETAL